MRNNVDEATVAGFGQEWSAFHHGEDSGARRQELRKIFDLYFDVFPWDRLSASAEGFDAGCGTGRWASFVAPRVGRLHCIDASEQALGVAERNLANQSNCVFHHASLQDLPFKPGSMDFGYSLGVLHHTPDPAAGLRACVSRLREGAPFLVYLYYALDNRPPLFRTVWRASDHVRRTVARLPFKVRYGVSQALAAGVYLPLARSARALERVGVDVSSFPLSAYRDRSFYTMRTDALDRFGTRLEHRFTRIQVEQMMLEAGLEHIRFVEAGAFWTAVGFKTA